MFTLNPTPEMIQYLYWITLFAVLVSSASAVLKAGCKQFDLFGTIMIAITTGLGGGSLRDILLERSVFWIDDQMFFIVSLLSAVLIFLVARLIHVPTQLFLIPDAAGLATFAIAGTLVALMLGTPWLIASFMGVMTGTIGGIFRDLLCNETPIVFHSSLYATVSWLGSLFFIGLLSLNYTVDFSASIAGLSIFLARMLAIRYDLHLPKFRFKP